MTLGLDRLDRWATSDVKTVIDDFISGIGDWGFDVAAAGVWLGSQTRRAPRFFFNTWPTDWLEIYERERCFEADFVVATAANQSAPFLFTEALQAFARADNYKAVWARGVAYGWVDGFGVPVHGPGGTVGLVSLATKRPLTLRLTERATIAAMATYVHDRCRKEIGLGADYTAPDLTRRERECLTWVAYGRTDEEIAVILGISRTTVRSYIDTARAKLEADSRAQAVALMAMHGLL